MQQPLLEEPRLSLLPRHVRDIRATTCPTKLQVVLDLAKDTFSDEPGTTDVCTHAVDTGDCKPISYAISPIKLAGVKQEI